MGEKFNSVKPSEVRLGNYIYNCFKYPYIVTSICYNDYKSNKTNTEIGAVLYDGSDDKVKWSSNLYQPIPITKEFLLKNGFNNYNNRYELLREDSKIILDGEWLEIQNKSVEPGDFYPFLRCKCRCKYIHQLQNALADNNININLTL